ncbi:MAG: cell division protein FtsZ, partial [Proteobacteria bacterium]|nr:cell division protein FtsZ [Pseudomonadota bacterium]
DPGLPDEGTVEEFDWDRDQRIADVGNKDLFEQQKNIDYLDIPSFLRTQAD